MPRLTMQRKRLAIGAGHTVEREDGELAYVVDGKLRFASTFSIDDRDGRELARDRETLLTLDS